MEEKRKRSREKRWKSFAVCGECTALCCRGLTIQVSRPRTRAEEEELSQYLYFDTARVFIRNRRWYVIVEGNCIYLSRENRCTVYEGRPQRCRRHEPPDCERFGRWYDVIFETPEELSRFLSRERTKAGGKA